MKASQIVALDDFALQAARGLSERHAALRQYDSAVAVDDAGAYRHYSNLAPAADSRAVATTTA